MTCEEALLLLSGHLDHENTPEEEIALQAHLSDCGTCRRVLQELTAMEQELTELETPPEDLTENVMKMITEEAAKGKKRRTYRWAGLITAAALALAIGVGTLGLPGEAAQTTGNVPAPACMVQPAVASAPAEFALEDDGIAVQSETEPDAQALADSRQADIAVLRQTVPELEGCPYETLEDGSLLYTLPENDGAVELSRLYGAELYRPADGGAQNGALALVVPD